MFKRYLLVLALFTLGNSSNMFLLLRAREMGLPESQAPLLWALASGMAMLLPASLVFGWLWQTFSPETAFGFSAGCAILAAVLLKFWVPTQSAHTTGQLLKR